MKKVTVFAAKSQHRYGLDLAVDPSNLNVPIVLEIECEVFQQGTSDGMGRVTIVPTVKIPNYHLVDGEEYGSVPIDFETIINMTAFSEYMEDSPIMYNEIQKFYRPDLGDKIIKTAMQNDHNTIMHYQRWVEKVARWIKKPNGEILPYDGLTRYAFRNGLTYHPSEIQQAAQ